MSTLDEMNDIAQLMRLDVKYAVRMGVPADIFASQEESIQRSIKEANVRGFRMAATDIVQALGDWEPQSLVAEFLKEVKAATGKSAFEIAGHPAKRLAKILKKGAIKNESEFYLLKEHSAGNTQEADQIEKMLIDYEDTLR